MRPGLAARAAAAPAAAAASCSGRCLCPPRPRRSRLQAVRAADREDDSSAAPELDVAVFRFTLGIPGIDDALVPRIVGLLGAAGLAANHFIGGGGGGGGSAALSRAEALGAFLAAACVATPTVEAVLKESEPGRGRRAAAALPGAAPVFAVVGGGGGGGGSGGGGGGAAPPLSGPAAADDALASELAWASYALLRNTNAAAVLVVGDRSRGGGGRGEWEGLLVRGAAPAAVAAAPAPLAAAAAGVAALAAGADPALAAVLTGRQAGPSPLWVPDLRAAAAAAAPGWECVAPPGAGCAAVAPLVAGGGSGRALGALVVVGDRPRGLTARDRAWVGAVAAKLGGALGG